MAYNKMLLMASNIKKYHQSSVVLNKVLLESDHTHFVLFTADFTQQWQG
jgi:hypothetical protein